MESSLVFLFVLSAFLVSLCIYFAICVFPKQVISEETQRRPRSFVSNAFFREFWYFVMRPLKEKMISWGVSPNVLSWSGFILSAIAGYFFSQKEWGWGAWMVILASTCDVYDGLLARAQGISRKSGAFLDSILDRAGESTMFCGLAWAFRDDAFWFIVLFITFTSSQLVSYSRARAEGLGFQGTRGFFQRAERMIVICIGMALVPLVEFLFQAGNFILHLTLLSLCIGSVQTAYARCASIYREIRETER